MNLYMEKIFKTLSKYSQIPISEMNPNTNIVIDLGMSSLEILSCVFDLEVSIIQNVL